MKIRIEKGSPPCTIYVKQGDNLVIHAKDDEIELLSLLRILNAAYGVEYRLP